MVSSGAEIRVTAVVALLSSLVGLTGFLSVASHVTTAYAAAFGALFLCAVWIERSGGAGLPRWALNTAAVVIVGATLTRLTLSDPVIPILDALTVLLGIKFVERKKFRDYMQIYAVAVLLLAGSALVSLGMTFLLYAAVLLVLLSLSVVFLAYLSQDGEMRLDRRVVLRIAVKSLLIPAAALPLAALLFIVLPRTNYPLLNFMNAGEGAMTGFSDTVRLGTVSGIQEDSSVIFRVRMAGIDDRALYWRGIVLDSFDGTGWRSTPGKEGGAPVRREEAGRITQTFYLEPYGSRHLFTLDAPLAVSGIRGVTAHGDHSFSVGYDIRRRIKYDARSVPGGIIREGPADRAVYLQLPGSLSRKIRELAAAMTVPGDERATARALTTFLASGGFTYTLQGLPLGDSPLEDFLFIRKQGNCEYFASALAVLLRSAGIPSRVVGGYLGGYYNDVGEYYMVLQKNAHVWVEAYLEGAGWLRLDPTPAAGPAGGASRERDMATRVRLMLDSISYYWNAVVLPYDLDRQISLLRQVRAGLTGPDLPSLKALRRIAAPLALIGMAVVIALAARHFLRNRVTREQRMVRDFHRALARAGYRRAPSEGLEEFAARIQEAMLKERALRFVKEFQKIYYRDRDLRREDAVRLREIIRSMRHAHGP